MAEHPDANEKGKESKLLDKAWVLVGNFFKKQLERFDIHIAQQTPEGQEPTSRKILAPLISINDPKIEELKKIEDYWTNKVDAMLGQLDGDPPRYLPDGNLTEYYGSVGPYTDPLVTAYEIVLFREGNNTIINKEVTKTGTISKTDIKCEEVIINPAEVIFPDGEKEVLYPFGFEKLDDIISYFKDTLNRIVSDKYQALESTAADPLKTLSDSMIHLLSDVSKYEKQHHGFVTKAGDIMMNIPGKIKHILDHRPKLIRFKHTYKVIKPFILVKKDGVEITPLQDILDMSDIGKLKEQIVKIKNIEVIKFHERIYKKYKGKFNDTFEVYPWEIAYTSQKIDEDWFSKQRFYNKIQNKDEVFTKIKDKYKFSSKIVSEYAGLDFRGYPLEVYQRPDGVWEVLTDRWWHGIYINKWQRQLIEIKIGKRKRSEAKYESLRRLPKNYENIIPGDFNDIKTLAGQINKMLETFKYPGRIRTVNKYFVGDVDPLMMGVYISNEYDSYRDDFRDARYHPWSKSIYDYTRKMYRWDRNKLYNNPIHKGHIAEDEIHLKYDPSEEKKNDSHGYIYAHPDLFNIGIPDDEKEITREYDGFDIFKKNLDGTEKDPVKDWKETKKDPDPEQDMLINPDTNLHYKPERRPSHLNPAFDRRALGSGAPYIHWGRMYYYEPVTQINRFSENPYPTISTRGIAKYIVNYVLRKEKLYSQQQHAVSATSVGYDYGIRKYGSPYYRKQILTEGHILNYSQWLADESG